WPGTFAEAGLAPAEDVAPPVPASTGVEGETAFAAESPEFDATTVTLKAWPTFTGWDGTETVVASAAGASTTRLAGAAVAAGTVWPLLASVPDAVAEKVAVPVAAPRY